MKQEIKKFCKVVEENHERSRRILTFFGVKYPILFQTDLTGLINSVDEELNKYLSYCLTSTSKKWLIPYLGGNSWHDAEVFLTKNPGLNHKYYSENAIDWFQIRSNMKHNYKLSENCLLKLSVLDNVKGINYERLLKFHSYLLQLIEINKKQSNRDENRYYRYNWQVSFTIKDVLKLEAQSSGVFVRNLIKKSTETMELLEILNHHWSYDDPLWSKKECKDTGTFEYNETFLLLDKYYDQIIKGLDMLEQVKKDDRGELEPLLKCLKADNLPFKVLQELKQ